MVNKCLNVEEGRGSLKAAFKGCCACVDRTPPSTRHSSVYGLSANYDVTETLDEPISCASYHSYTYSTGEHYDGSREGNTRHGWGTYFYANGDVYSGNWFRNIKSGWGIYLRHGGEKYEGTWSYNMKHGLGCLVHRNGTRYVGQFVDDVKHGRGLAMHRNGLINAEVWDRGILVSKAPVFEEIYSNHSQQQSQDGVMSPSSDNSMSPFEPGGGNDKMCTMGVLPLAPPNSIIIHQEPLSSELMSGDQSPPNLLEQQQQQHDKGELLPVTTAQPEGWETKSNAACIDEWTVSDIGVLLTGLGLGQVRDAFEKNDVDGFVFERLVGNLDDVEDDEMLATPSNAAGDTSNTTPRRHSNNTHFGGLNHEGVVEGITISDVRDHDNDRELPYHNEDREHLYRSTTDDSAVYTCCSAAHELGLTDPTLRRILLIVIRVLSKLKQRALMPTITTQHLHQWFSALEVNYGDIDFQCLIGEGGYGRVYRARYMHKHVACKVFRGGGTTRQQPRDKVDDNDHHHPPLHPEQQHISKDFWSELNTLARLRHPNITLLLGISLAPRYSLLTEYVPCGSLFDLLHRTHPGHKKNHDIDGWSLPRVVSIGREICLGMSYLHTHGVLHCDLKSSNVLISESWEVKICDFGLSFMTGESNRDARLPLGCVGTHHWMAPEILRGEEYSQYADVYSFGMILWEMVYRMIPYAHLSALQVIGIVGYGHRVHHHGPSRPLLPMDDCPMPLRNIMMRSLRYVPATRPSFVELAAELSRLHKNSVIDVEESMNAFFGIDRPSNMAHSTWQSTTPWSRQGVDSEHPTPGDTSSFLAGIANTEYGHQHQAVHSDQPRYHYRPSY